PPSAIRVGGLEETRLDARVDDDDLVAPAPAALPQDQVLVVGRNGHDKVRLGDLLAEHVPIDMETGSLRGEAVRNAGESMDEEPRGGRVVGEMAMDVLDALVLHDARRVSNLWKDPDSPDEEVLASPGALHEGCQSADIGARSAA